MTSIEQTNSLDEKFSLDPPHNVIGMKVLNRSKFDKIVQIKCLKAKSKDLKFILKIVKPFLLKKENLKPVIKLGKF